MDLLPDHVVWYTVGPWRLWLIETACFDGERLPPLPDFLRLVDRFLNPDGTGTLHGRPLTATLVPYGFRPGSPPDYVHCRRLFTERLQNSDGAVLFQSWDEWLDFIIPVERQSQILTYFTRHADDRALDQQTAAECTDAATAG